jgi:hypothetical protein
MPSQVIVAAGSTITSEGVLSPRRSEVAGVLEGRSQPAGHDPAAADGVCG